MNKIKSIIIMGILLLSILIIISPVSAATYHVYPGDDIENIIGSAISGDTIYVHAGTYLVDEIKLNADNITIIGDNPSNTIIDVSSGGDEGIDGVGRDYITIKNITVKNANNDGIDVDDYALIENCIVYGSGDNGFEVGDDCTLKNCLAYNNDDDGFNDEEDCTYINCTAANNGEDGFYNDYGYTKVINCIAVGNGEDGFDIDTDFEHPGEITYSNAWDNTGDDYDEQPAGIGCISVNPFFMKGPLGDFYLFKSSPCVNKGSDSATNLGLSTGFTTNIKGVFDNGTVDMGYHYSSNGGSDSSLPINKILDILKNNQDKE